MAIPQWRRDGAEPDYRFSLANERTFLAWIRTALALIAGAIVIDQFVDVPGREFGSTVLAICVTVVAAILTVGAYLHWRRNEQAMRHGEPLPHSTLFVGMVATMLAAATAVIVVLL